MTAPLSAHRRSMNFSRSAAPVHVSKHGGGGMLVFDAPDRGVLINDSDRAEMRFSAG